MNEEVINPGYSNKIYELSHKNTRFNKSQFINTEVEDKGICFSGHVDCYKEYVRLTITVKYIQIAKETSQILEVIDALYSFKLFKISEINPEDLLIVLQNCIKRMILAKKLETYSFPNLPAIIPEPLLEDNVTLLKELSEKINCCQNVSTNNSSLHCRVSQ